MRASSLTRERHQRLLQLARTAGHLEAALQQPDEAVGPALKQRVCEHLEVLETTMFLIQAEDLNPFWENR